MTKEELIELKKQLSTLTEEEQKERDLYLRGLANGEIQGPPVGYPSIDKPWLRYYRDNPIKKINPNQTIYSMVFDQEDFDRDAISYLGTTWTYRKLKEEVDKCAKALKANGVNEGDVVLVGVSNSIESIVNMLAINKIGAVSKWFDLRASAKDIEEYAKSSNCKYMIALDMILPKVNEIIDNTDLKTVIVTSPVGSTTPLVKTLFGMKNIISGTSTRIPKDNRYIKYEKFIETGIKYPNFEAVPFDKTRKSIMIQSSGTTGKPKTIVHSDYSATQCTREIAYSDLPLGKDKKVLVALPPWIAYGLGDAIILPLSLGSQVELCPTFDPDAVFKKIGTFSLAFAAPFHYRYLKDNILKLSPNKRKQLQEVDCLVSGGDKITVEENREFEQLFGTVLVNGYGDNEGWGALSVNPTQNNRYGTVGIPKYDEAIISYDTDQKIELPYGTGEDEVGIGEICSLTNTLFLEYENNLDETNACKVRHEDGRVWLHTGDLGYIDKDGYVHLCGRARRVITRLGFKISAYTIEDSITQLPFVKECVAVSVNDEHEEHVPMVYVVLKDDEKESVKDAAELIKIDCENKLKEYEVPKYVRIVDELPYTQNGKYDFRKLEEDGNNYVRGIAKAGTLTLSKRIN
ncbi:MAG: acyl--CoA ligase [Bacilli bacterium]|nr:acyl--CoA ligase [Bacilli bacterium]